MVESSLGLRITTQESVPHQNGLGLERF